MNDKSSTKDQTVKQWEKEKSSLLTELTAQNSRLTQQLKGVKSIKLFLFLCDFLL